MKKTAVFWTGGFDSTYRVCELLMAGRDIRPVYILDRDRKSFRMELSAMAGLRAALEERFAGGGSLLPLEIYMKEDFPPSGGIKSAFENLAGRVHTGTQYGWLGQFSRTMAGEYGKIELCTNRHYPPAPWQADVFDDPHADNPGLKNGPARALFGNCSFPLLRLTKKEMESAAAENGFYGILMETWFCHRPVANLPCGGCGPCRTARLERKNLRFAFCGGPAAFLLSGVDRLQHPPARRGIRAAANPGRYRRHGSRRREAISRLLRG